METILNFMNNYKYSLYCNVLFLLVHYAFQLLRTAMCYVCTFIFCYRQLISSELFRKCDFFFWGFLKLNSIISRLNIHVNITGSHVAIPGPAIRPAMHTRPQIAYSPSAIFWRRRFPCFTQLIHSFLRNRSDLLDRRW